MSGEPNHIKIRSFEYWQSRKRYKSLPSGQRPTLGQLRESTVWTWGVLQSVPTPRADGVCAADYPVGRQRIQRQVAAVCALH
jgi:hypothetical protein